MRNLKVALVGLGKMGLLHASILKVMPNVEVVALCDKSRLMSYLGKKMFKRACIVNDIGKLSDLGLDAVYVTTPIPSHFPIVKTLCLERTAKNVFVEKTLASSWNEAKELCELAKSSAGVNMVGYMKRFAVTFMKAKSVLDEDSLGDLVSFKAYAYSSDFLESDKSSKNAISRGGVLRDLGSHALDLALWFFGELEVDPADRESPTDSENHACFSVKGSKGLKGGFDVSWCMENFRLPEIGMTVWGSKGNMKVNDDEVNLELQNGKSYRWYRHDLNDNVRFLLGAPEYFRENESFITSVSNDIEARPSFFDASKVEHLIDLTKHGDRSNE